uniref:Uncharacterized protein n=1 Tax=Cacopsylla melanoneura TaxID=428564 RepID=A0A8D8PMT0_9HEMI
MNLALICLFTLRGSLNVILNILNAKKKKMKKVTNKNRTCFNTSKPKFILSKIPGIPDLSKTKVPSVSPNLLLKEEIYEKVCDLESFYCMNGFNDERLRI